MYGVETIQHAMQSVVATRPRAPALDAKPVVLADDVNVGQMRHPPFACARSGRIERFDVERLIHRGVSDAPDQRGHSQVAAHDHDCIRERRHHEPKRIPEIRQQAGPSGRRPRHQGNHRGKNSQDNTRSGARNCAQTGALLWRQPMIECFLGKVPQRFAAQHVPWLDG